MSSSWWCLSAALCNYPFPHLYFVRVDSPGQNDENSSTWPRMGLRPRTSLMCDNLLIRILDSVIQALILYMIVLSWPSYLNDVNVLKFSVFQQSHFGLSFRLINVKEHCEALATDDSLLLLKLAEFCLCFALSELRLWAFVKACDSRKMIGWIIRKVKSQQANCSFYSKMVTFNLWVAIPFPRVG